MIHVDKQTVVFNGMKNTQEGLMLIRIGQWSIIRAIEKEVERQGYELALHYQDPSQPYLYAIMLGDDSNNPLCYRILVPVVRSQTKAPIQWIVNSGILMHGDLFDDVTGYGEYIKKNYVEA